MGTLWRPIPPAPETALLRGGMPRVHQQNRAMVLGTVSHRILVRKTPVHDCGNPILRQPGIQPCHIPHGVMMDSKSRSPELNTRSTILRAGLPYPGSLKSQKALENNRFPIPAGCFSNRNEKAPQAYCLQGLQMVTGAGFEPATFGL